ncbi:universal stress protein A-like protein [Neltuma alba]|uniref:universal stress protein A-like protein n=1 Tax=Neltuma alba TaxID=207710 RepID=UPI0010A45991|nr:universal stress protein A-like protein [Prosopis alba]XP_028790182.1 universal stress protein A-like protein [Prosopis alba]
MDATAVVGGGDQVSGGTGKDGAERRIEMKVVVAIDDSDGSFYALKWALDNLFVPMATPEATLASGGMVFLVHVHPKLFEYGYPVEAVFHTTAAALDSVKRAQEEASGAILCRALQMCKDKLVKAETMILRGDPREMICHAAEQVHADLLVVGSRGLGPVSRTFLGSVSDYCANHAKTPVLIVKTPADDSDKQ